MEKHDRLNLISRNEIIAISDLLLKINNESSLILTRYNSQ